MAVRALPRSLIRAPQHVASVPAAILAVTLSVPALDLFFSVQPAGAFTLATGLASAAIAAVLVLLWLRYPRTSWLFAASLSAVANLVMRLLGADVAPLLSLLTVVALGVGGAFASPEISLESA